MRIFVLFLLSMCSLNISAQTDSCIFSISGKVLDVDTKEPIPYASIKVSGEEKFTMTNVQGEFELKNLCSEENTLIISCFGYCDSICQHQHRHGKSPHFYLTQKVQKLETVVIEAEQNKEQGTQSIAQQTIDRADIVNSPTRSLASSIANIEGVTFTSTGSNVQLPIIHGLYGNRVLIVNNGLKHGFQNWSKDHAPEIDIASANSITVLKGASGVRFGPEALGGAIIVESDPLYLNEALKIDLGSAYQTNGRGYTSSLGLNQGFKNWSYFLNGSYTKIGDRNSPDYQLTNSGKEEKSFGAGTRYHHKNFDAKLYYSYVDQNLALLRSSIAESGNSFIRSINAEKPVIINSFSYDIKEPNQLTTHHLGKVELNWWYSEKAKLTFRAGRQYNYRQEFDVRRNAEKPIIDLNLITSDYQLEWNHPDWLELEGLIGLQYFNQENTNNPGTGTTAFIPNYTSNRWSAFLIESKHFGKDMFELGMRLDLEENFIAGRETSQALFRNDYAFNNFTVSLGYVREISETTSFRSNLGTAWRSPNVAELFSFGQNGFKSSFGLLRYYYNNEGNLRTNRVIEFANSDVEAENGYKLINELEINKEKNRQVITVYTHYIKNYIFDRPYSVIGTIRGPMPVFIFEQADALFTGLDYSWKRKWTENLSGKLGLSYLFPFNVEDNEALINQPPLQVQYGLKWNLQKLWKFESSDISLQPSYTFQQFQAPRTVTPESLIEGTTEITADSEIFDFADTPKGYFLLNLSWNFKWKHLSGEIRIENVFNQAYRDYLNEMRYFADEPGRNIIFSLNYQIKTKISK